MAAAAAAFTEVLDQFVAGFESREPAAAAPPHTGVATRSLFWFEGVSELTRRPRRSLAAGAGRRDTAAPRRHRALSPAQREALDHLNALGASLDAAFTGEELRSAFRSLAHAYHPDRHPGSRQCEKARLAASFASARSAYLVLKTAA